MKGPEVSEFVSSASIPERGPGSERPDPLDGFIYLLHWRHRSGRVEHYVGWTRNLEARLKAHYSGSGGCPTTRRFRRAGMRGRLVRLWRGTMWGERRMQQTLIFPVDCPICCDCEIETVRCEGRIEALDENPPIAPPLS